MKTFKKQATQGDLLLIRIDEFPEGLTEVAPQDGKYVLAHSETGHNHTIKSNQVKMLQDSCNELVSYLSVLEQKHLIHERTFDTHETITVDPGKFKVIRQREHSIKGFRRATD